jgi:effector-binding domain-containing protein
MLSPQTALPFYSLTFTVQTSLSQLGQYVRNVASELYKEAVQNELEITGAIYWIYEGMDGNPETVFDLTIALPISKPEKAITSEKFSIKMLQSFTYVSTFHFGEWNRLSASYVKIIGEITGAGLTMTSVYREQYIAMDFDNPEANVTIIQVGVVEKD